MPQVPSVYINNANPPTRPDDPTMEMMTLFYTELSKTKKPVYAFDVAQKIMRDKYPNEPKK